MKEDTGTGLIAIKPEELNVIVAELGDLNFQKDAMILNFQDIVKQTKLKNIVARNIMKEGTHYGVIPGCEKPSLFKAGAEVLNSAFRLRAEYSFEDKKESKDMISYTIKCKLFHIPTGQFFGESLGACNSYEVKYHTRPILTTKATEDEKASALRKEKRKKFDKTTRKLSEWEVYIVPTNPYEIQNTLLQMADKRAFVAATRSALGISDIFTQDVEDFEGIDLTVAYDGFWDVPEGGKPEVQQPQSKPAAAKVEKKEVQAQPTAPNNPPSESEKPPVRDESGEEIEFGAPAKDEKPIEVRVIGAVNVAVGQEIPCVRGMVVSARLIETKSGALVTIITVADSKATRTMEIRIGGDHVKEFEADNYYRFLNVSVKPSKTEGVKLFIADSAEKAKGE